MLEAQFQRTGDGGSPVALDWLEGELADADSLIATTSLGLQQEGRKVFPGPLSVSTKYLYLQEL